MIQPFHQLLDHETARFLQPETQIQRTDEGLESVGEHGGVVHAARRAHAGAQQREVGKPEAARRFGELRVVDDGGLAQRQPSLGFVRKTFEEPCGRYAPSTESPRNSKRSPLLPPRSFA